jgi:hypothetical protein
MTFIETLLLILAIALSIIAIRISFKFDINKFLEHRRNVNMAQLKNICPHGNLRLEGNKFIFESFFSSPPGTIQWDCSQCGLVVNSEDDVKRMSESITPDSYIKKHKKFHKQAKKLKLY